MKYFTRKSALILISFFYLISILYAGNWKKGKTSINYDAAGYYSYLPAFFIYHDLSFKFLSDKKFVAQYVEINEMQPETWFLRQTANGNQVPKYAIGVAILTSPFFLIAHFLASVTGAVDNGYSMIFKIAHILCSLFYTFLGLIVLSNILKRYFSEQVVFFTLIAIALCTNMYLYATAYIGMSHLYTFCLFAVLLHYTLKWYQTPKLSFAIYIGLLTGLITCARATNIIVVLIPIFYDVKSIDDIKARLTLFKRYILQLLVVGLFFLIGFFPQLLFWKIAGGNWLFYSYTTERFYFLDPRILSCLFSFRSGWLIYTPIMIFALVGFIQLRKQLPQFFLSVLLFFFLNIYIISCWWCWWYGVSFSLRPMVESYVLLAFPMAAFINNINKRYKTRGLSLVALITLFFLFLNILQTSQHAHGIIRSDKMTFKAYLFAIGKMKYTPAENKKFEKLLDSTVSYDPLKPRK